MHGTVTMVVAIEPVGIAAAGELAGEAAEVLGFSVLGELDPGAVEPGALEPGAVLEPGVVDPGALEPCELVGEGAGWIVEPQGKVMVEVIACVAEDTTTSATNTVVVMH